MNGHEGVILFIGSVHVHTQLVGLLQNPMGANNIERGYCQMD